MAYLDKDMVEGIVKAILQGRQLWTLKLAIEKDGPLPDQTFRLPIAGFSRDFRHVTLGIQDGEMVLTTYAPQPQAEFTEAQLLISPWRSYLAAYDGYANRIQASVDEYIYGTLRKYAPSERIVGRGTMYKYSAVVVAETGEAPFGLALELHCGLWTAAPVISRLQPTPIAQSDRDIDGAAVEGLLLLRRAWVHRPAPQLVSRTNVRPPWIWARCPPASTPLDVRGSPQPAFLLPFRPIQMRWDLHGKPDRLQSTPVGFEVFCYLDGTADSQIADEALPGVVKLCTVRTALHGGYYRHRNRKRELFRSVRTVCLTNIILSLFVLNPFRCGPQITLEMGQPEGTSPCEASVTWHAEPPHIV